MATLSCPATGITGPTASHTCDGSAYAPTCFGILRGLPRLDVTFPSGGLRCAAWLHLPEGDGPAPCVVLAHGFAATRSERLGAYAERFAAAGLAALAFDYRHFGDSEGSPRQLLDHRLQQEDYAAAIAYVRSREEVDPARIAIWGTSFSGAHVLHLAARDPSLAAAVMQTPMVDGLVQVLRVPPAAFPGITARALRDVVAGSRGRPPVTMPVRGRPGEVAALTSPSSYDGYGTLVEPWSRWRDDVAARVLLQVRLYRPIRDAERVACPLLVCVADRDDLTPPEPAIRCAERAPRGELERYDAGHWDVYLGETFESVVADEIEFLTRHLVEGSG